MPECTGRPLVISMGDVCGIGPEVVAAQWLGALPPQAVVVGSVAVMQRALTTLVKAGHRAEGVEVQALEALKMQPHLPLAAPQQRSILWVWEPPGLPDGLAHLPCGQIDAKAGAAAALCVREAARLVLSGWARAMVTAPLHKEALAAAGEAFPGHTELLQALATPPGQPLVPVRMMLANPELKTVLVSIHVSLRQAIEAVTLGNVLQTIRITHHSLLRMGLSQPRIAVAGLNPHAGEGGLFGDEELHTIGPAIQAARAEGIDASGPWAPDTVFMRARHSADHPGEFDAVVAMYHDQGLIPVKYLGVADGVNVTLGLPFVRTSPDHGTAFDLAGTGRADPSSLAQAMEMALALSAR
jgi:4-hydroxythreonine-4-phosphate dehydrogenase